MKKFIIILSIFNSIVSVSADSDCCPSTCTSGKQFGKTFFHPREATQDASVRMRALADKRRWLDDTADCYGVFDMSLIFRRSTDASGLGTVFSFTNCDATRFAADSLKVTPGTTEVAANALSNARAIDFGLSPSFDGTLTLKPRITTFVLDLDFYTGLDGIICGSWLRLSAPIVYSKYDMNPCSIATTGTTVYATDFVGTTTVAVPYTSITPAWEGLTDFGEVLDSDCGKLVSCSRSKIRLGALVFDIGYDVIRNDCLRIALGFHGVAGLGNTPTSCTLFEPIAGTYNWQAGLLASVDWRIYDCGCDNYLRFYSYGEFTHMFKRKQSRLFGLDVGDSTAGNSWLLLKQFDPGDGSYTGVITRGSSFLGRSIKVGNNFMADMAFMLDYHWCCWDFALGYNFWYRSRDIAQCCPVTAACRTGCDRELLADSYGIKGVAETGPADNDTTFYSSLDSNIHASGTRVNASLVSATEDYVTEKNVTPCVALAPSAYSNKIFGSVGYVADWCCLTPFLSLSAMYEWGESNHAMDQWGLWLTGGIRF